MFSMKYQLFALIVFLTLSGSQTLPLPKKKIGRKGLGKWTTPRRSQGWNVTVSVDEGKTLTISMC